MSLLRKRWVIFKHPRADIRFGRGVRLGPGFSLNVFGGGTFIAGPNVEFRRGFQAEIYEDGRITIGEGSVFTYNVVMQCTTSIDVGERCIVAQAVTIVDGNHRFRDIATPVMEQGYDFDPVTIEEGATILSKCTVMSDVGTRSLVGANSVVTRAIPPYTLAVGAPAKPVEYFGPPEERPASLAE